LVAAIIDVGLPDRPGDALITDIRSRRPTLPILLTTGYADSSLRQRVADDPLLQIISKPFQIHNLEATIGQLGVRIRRDEHGQ
jgi:DNA-binding response OmpR family regulator